MEITARQFGQIEAACSALEEATEKNNTALRLVQVIKDNLVEIAKTRTLTEIIKDGLDDFGKIEPPADIFINITVAEEKNLDSEPLKKVLPELAVETSAAAVSDPAADIRRYGQELIAQGITMKELIKMVMEHFSLTQDAFAHLIKVNQGSLSKYLRNGERKDAVITGVTEFFGEDGGALNDHTRSAETHSPNGARIGSTESGAPEKYPKPRKGGAASNGSDGNFLGNDGAALKEDK